MKKAPSISIIIVNYNGVYLLRDCLSSVYKSNYPKNKYEVIVVDNNSQDGSCSFIRKNFPKVKLVRQKSNTGFATGNNIGYKHASGKYIVLLNNDTKVDPNWLSELAIVATQDSKVGIVASKILLDVPFIEVKITSTVVQQSDLDQSTDFSPRGVLLENISSDSSSRNLIWYATGFGKPEWLNGLHLRWSTGIATVLLPLIEEENNFSFVFHGYPSSDTSLSLNAKLSVANTELCSFSLSPNSVINQKISLKKSEYDKSLIWLVQNAGNLVLKDGYSKDIGGVTRILGKSVEEFYEPDSKFFSKKRTLLAACGAGMLVKREVIEKVGFFNQHYFMYYEDIDFSFRVWKHGWDIVLAPKAIIRHAHRATTGKNESAFFVSMIEKNHLFLLLTHFPLIVFLKEYIHFGSRLASAIMKQFLFRFIRWNSYQLWRVKAAGRVDAFLSFHKQLLSFIKIRFWWQTRQARTFDDMKKDLY